MTDLTEQEIAEGERLLALPGPEFARWFVGREDRTFATLRADRARIAELEAQLAERTRERDVARLYCAEVASYVCDPIYDKVENRAGIAADAEAMATGEMVARYLDIKMQTERAIRAEAERDAAVALLKELDAERERREAAEAVIHTCQWAMRQPLDGWKGECERKALDEARAHFARYKD